MLLYDGKYLEIDLHRKKQRLKRHQALVRAVGKSPSVQTKLQVHLIHLAHFSK